MVEVMIFSSQGTIHEQRDHDGVQHRRTVQGGEGSEVSSGGEHGWRRPHWHGECGVVNVVFLFVLDFWDFCCLWSL